MGAYALNRSILILTAIVSVVLTSSIVNVAVSQAVASRVVHGEYRNETIAGAERRGEENFELVVFADGSRTLSISSDLSARQAWFTVVLRAAADFRPLEAYASYWTGGGYKGSGRFIVEGEKLLADSSGPMTGQQKSETRVPALFSIGTHPVSADGWHTVSFEPSGPARQKFTLYSVEASADRTKPVLGKLVMLDIEYLGEETIEVPAGKFVTQRYRLAGMNDLWIHGPDRIVIRSDLPARGTRYVLTSLQSR